MAELDDFAAYSSLADSLIERTTKVQLAEAARLLALSVGPCRTGRIPRAEGWGV